jgi:CRISPR type III-A-associated RAMP protein Csm5
MNPVTLRTLTPVHVGSGMLYQSNIEYLYDGKAIAIIDEKKVLDVIGEEHIDQWVNIIEQKDRLIDYLKQRKPDFTLKDFAQRVISVLDDDIGPQPTLKGQLHNGLGQPVIPGSSIKGALRTALLTRRVMQKEETITPTLLKKRNGWSSANLEKQLLGDQRNDPLRFLRIGDAHFSLDTVALNMEIMNLYGEKWKIKKGSNQLTEMLWGNDETSLKLGFKSDLIRANKMNGYLQSEFNWLDDMKALCKEVNQHTRWLTQREFDFWKEQKTANETIDGYLEILGEVWDEIENCGENEMVLRLGAGSGWHFITGGWIKYLENLISDKEYKDLTSLLGKRDAPVFPKTRKMEQVGELLGFVKISM